jgi:glycosyltransferase involved in cell wall biosynthesis
VPFIETFLKSKVKSRVTSWGKAIMRLCISDSVPWDYNVETPYHRAFGGMQSAACYLSAALAKQGHEVSLLTHTNRPGTWLGVECLSWNDADSIDRMRRTSFDAIVSLTANPFPLRELFGQAVPIHLWTGHPDHQPPVQCLTHEQVRDQWDGFVFVSEWQRNCYIARFGLEPARTAIIRNAIAPVFENRFADMDAMVSAKASIPCRLAYTSSPDRGLQLLMAMFPLLTRPTHLHVYSSMALYVPGEADVPYRELYEQCRTTPSVEYFGAIPQPELATSLESVSILAYPNIVPETGCITAMEAMASGCFVVTSNLGALAETTEGFASLIDVDDDWYSYAQKYIAALEQAVDFTRSEAGLRHLWRQVQHINMTCTWQVRAKQWVSLLGGE